MKYFGLPNHKSGKTHWVPKSSLDCSDYFLKIIIPNEHGQMYCFPMKCHLNQFYFMHFLRIKIDLCLATPNSNPEQISNLH